MESPLLFLHVKSLPDPKGFGLRYDMIMRAFNFRKELKKRAGVGRSPNYIFAGDLNTMGMNYRGSKSDIAAAQEIRELGKAAQRRNMRLLSKTQPNTYWSNTYGRSDLDHVVAAKHLKFKEFSGKSVRVSGWTDESTKADKGKWVKTYSDHALLYFEVQKV